MTLLDRAVLALTNILIWVRHPWHCLDFSWRRKTLASFAAPRTQSALVQWRKLFDHDPRFVVFTDKLAAKQWARNHVPDAKTAEVVWVGDRAEDIPDALFAEGYVFKSNHATRQVYFPAREPLPRAQVNARLNGWVSRRYIREKQWAYLHITPRLFVERMIGDSDGMLDIDVRAHDGTASAAHIALHAGNSGSLKNYFDPEGRRLVTRAAHPLPEDFETPPSFFRAIEIAKAVSRGHDYLRIDFLCTREEAYLGEVTIYPASGMGAPGWPAQLIYRRWLERIDRSWFVSTPQPWPRALYQRAFRRWVAVRLAELPADADALSRVADK